MGCRCKHGVLGVAIWMFVGTSAAVSAQTVVSPGQSGGQATTPAARADLGSLEVEALGWLQNLIRINTTNPPGHELEAAKYLAGILQKEGITPEVIESTPGRGILVARLSASAVPDPSKALLIMGHLDVVGVDRSKWSVDPFAGVIKDGYLYGRGAIDDKAATVANVAVMVALKRSGARLTRDVIFLAEGDEEQGGEAGMQFAVEKHWDKIACGFAINEGGRVQLKNGKVQFVAIQASEKVASNVNVIASGTSGHASMPRADNPVVHLAAAIAKIGTYETPVQFNTITREYFEDLAKVTDDPDAAKWMRALDSSDRADHAARYISQANPLWNSMLRDTIAPTMLQAGIRANVIPAEARGTLNIRQLPGNMLDPLLAKLKELVNDPAVRFEVEPQSRPAPSSSLETDFYRSIVKTAGEEFPGAPTIPMMSTGATDSAFLRLREVQAYGLLPFPMGEEDEFRMHGNDERIPVESFRKGVEFLDRIVENFAEAK
jgi:acetylornithine deacetylase/succinyl-diaminopimelate desuccinylase-like protein